MIRRGRTEHLTAEEFATVSLTDVLELLSAADAFSIEDVRRRLDPERIARVLGVTQDGELHRPAVETLGEKLLSNGALGADLLVVPPGAGFPVHVHSGHHLLLCLSGPGTFSLAGELHEVRPGDLSMIEGSVPHAVGNPYEAPHILLAVGCPPRELDAEDRMTVTDWNGQPVLIEAGHAHDHTHHVHAASTQAA